MIIVFFFPTLGHMTRNMAPDMKVSPLERVSNPIREWLVITQQLYHYCSSQRAMAGKFIV